MLIGERIKSLRTGRGMTVAALAEQSGLSKGLVSQLENDKTSPSLATLERLAEGLGVPVAYLVLRPEEGINVVRAAERRAYQFGPDAIKVEVLASCAARSLKAVLVEFPPGSSTGSEAHAHGGEEFHLVLEGRIQAIQGEQSVVLEPGDTFHWKGCLPHRVVNVGECKAVVLAVTSTSVLEAVGQESEME